jgi:hypothetical protein
MGIFIRVDGIPAERRILPMLAIRIIGNQTALGRALAFDNPTHGSSAPATLANGAAGHCSERRVTRSAYPQSCTARSMVKNITLSFVVA